MGTRARRLWIALLIGCVFVWGTFAILRVRTLTRLRAELVAIESERRENLARFATEAQRIDDRIDQLEKDLAALAQRVAQLERR